MRPISISIFFPAYNEEANIKDSVLEVQEIVKTITDKYEIIIVDDGSKDQTGKIADELAEESEFIKVVHHEKNKGYGAALWSGIQKAKYQYVFFTDADLQFDLSELSILTHFVPTHQVVLGYRSLRRDSFLRLVNAKAWNLLNRLLFGLKVKDIDCAFKLMDRKLVASLPIKTRGAMMSAEMLIRLQRMGVVFKEIPVSHFPREEGLATGANPKVIIKAFKELWKLYQGKLGQVSRIELKRFAIIGVFNTITDIGIYFLLTRGLFFFADHLLMAKAASFLCGTVLSFFANRAWTFSKTSKLEFNELIVFYMTVSMGILVNLVATSILLDVFHLYDLVAVCGATVATFVWNFSASKLWVYNTKTPMIYRKKFGVSR